MEKIIFAKNLKKLDLLKIKNDNSNCKKIKINVFRNHSFEMIENASAPFLNFAGYCADFVYSDYDDSLNFFNINESDLNIVWIDVLRYKTTQIDKWLEERILYLRNKSKAPILLCTLNTDNTKINSNLTSDFYFFEIMNEIEELGERKFDFTKEPYSGTKLSSLACIRLARKICLQYIPGILKHSLKALIFDLDNTLYDGILGEDGIEGIKLTPEHIQLQKRIKMLGKQGYLICLASKNEQKDVVELFKTRNDFALKFEDISAYEINWERKSKNILKIAKKLNIGADSMLFADDNPAEIQDIAMNIPFVKTVLAYNAQYLDAVLQYYPGLLKLKNNEEDNLRSADIKANQERNLYAKTLDKEEYFKKLNIELTFYINPLDKTPRVSELFNKTNQFIFNYKRFGECEINELIQSGCIIAASMSDMLSDSGIIALLAAKSSGNSLEVQDLVISCRALGRNLEDIMINKLFSLACKKLNLKKDVIIHYKKGPRNFPAMNWLETAAADSLAQEGSVRYVIPDKILTHGLKVRIEDSVETLC